jgi:O-antigen/teichoic acid export membrane protein
MAETETAQAQRDSETGGRLDGLLSRASQLAFGKTERASAARGALFAFGIRAFSAVMAYALHIVLARLLGDFSFGIYVTAWTWVVLIGSISPLGLHIAVVRFVGEYEAAGDEARLRGVVIGVPVIVTGLAVAVALIGVATIYTFPGLLSQPFMLPVTIAAFCLPLFALSEAQDGVARAFGWNGVALIPVYLQRPLVVLAVMGILLLAGWPADAPSAMIATVLASLSVVVVQAVFIITRLRHKLPAGPRVFTPRAWFAVSLPILFVEGFYLLLTNTDIAMLGFLVPPEQVSVYFAAAKTMVIVSFAYFAVRASLEWRFAKFYHAGDQEGFAAALKDGTRWMFIPSVGFSILVVGAGYWLLGLYGEGFTAGLPVLGVLALGLVLRSAAGPTSSVLMMSGAQQQTAFVYAGAFVANIALNLVLIPRLGIMGAAAATAITMGLEMLLLGTLVKRHTGVDVFIWSVLKPGGAR